MKQVLLMMPSYYNFDDVIVEGLVNYSNCKVSSIDTSSKLAYRHFFDRVLNFSSKIFLNKNLKPSMQKKRMVEQINHLNKIDYLIVNRVDLIKDSILDILVKKSDKKILMLWDSISKVHVPKEKLPYFDLIYSFDAEDCKKYHFKKIENFHFWENQYPITAAEHDVVFLGTLDSREADLNKVVDYLKTVDKTSRIFLYAPPGRKLNTSAEINRLNKIVPFKESVAFAKEGKIILDLAHHNQKGLSFRVFEAMVLRKKLITTNKQIRHYDFYRPNNIFIIDDIDNIDIPKEFWDIPYEEISEELVDKYAIENWVKKILSNG